MNGWIPFDAEGWEETVELLQASGKPWPRAAVYFDLRWHVDQQQTLPGRPELKKRWGWKVEEHVKRLLAHPELWWDPTKGAAPTSRKELEQYCPVRKRVPQVAPGRNQDAPGGSRSDTGEPDESSGNHQDAPGGPSTLQVTSIARSSPHPTPSPPPPQSNAREAPLEVPVLAIEQARDELLQLQAQQEPDLPPEERDGAALVRALFSGSTVEQLRTLWAWSGCSDDPDVAGCSRGRWRRWSSLLRPPLGAQRLAKALAWQQAGCPAPARAAGPPARASPPRAGRAGDGVLEAMMRKRLALDEVIDAER